MQIWFVYWRHAVIVHWPKAKRHLYLLSKQHIMFKDFSRTQPTVSVNSSTETATFTGELDYFWANTLFLCQLNNCQKCLKTKAV